ncbi:MAG: hypothetical protein ABI797_02510 [Chloroflexota bacterium]
MRTLMIGLVVLLAGCTGAPGQQTQPPAASGTSTPAPSPVNSGQPTPPRTVAPGQSDEPDLRIGGTITWTASATSDSNPPTIESVTGTASIVIHVVNPYLLLAEREDMSTYAYDYTSNRDECPSTHEEGTLESQVGVGTTDEWDYSIGTLNPGGPIGEDLHLQIIIPDYCGPSMGGDVDRSRAYVQGFPDCEPRGDQLFARFDGENYVIDCDVIGWGGANEFTGTVSGHVSGTLSPLDGPHL